MKIGSYAPKDGKLESIKHFRPSQTLLFVLNYGLDVEISEFRDNTTKLNVNLQNSKTGNLTSLIPYVGLSRLSEISTFNEGVVLMEGKHITFPVMLHPTDNISLDNDKYLEISLIDIPVFVSSVDVFSFETGSLTDFVSKYNKMNCPAGSARVKFSVGESDLIALPKTGFDSIRLTYKNGLVSDMSSVEMGYYMAQNNDVTAYKSVDGGVKVIANVLPGNYADFPALQNTLSVGGLSVSGTSESYLSICGSYIFNLLEVDSIEIIRDSDSVDALEFILGDFIKNA